MAEKRTGKQVLVLEAGREAAVCMPAEGDTVAVIGENRKLLVFPLEQVPEMARGRGVQLQSYKDGGLADAKVFTRKEGLSWRLGDRMRTETDAQPLARQPRRRRQAAAERLPEVATASSRGGARGPGGYRTPQALCAWMFSRHSGCSRQ